MTISILCPTRQRTHALWRMVDSARKTASEPPEIVFYVDDDDRESERFVTGLINMQPDDFRPAMVLGPRITMSDMWNRCAEGASGDLLMFVDDEAVFHTPGWDRLVAAEFERWPDRAVLVYGNDMVHGEILASYFFAHRIWLHIFGRLTPRQFSYGYADVWCYEVAKAAGRAIYLPEVAIENMAPKDQPPDHIHAENHERAVRDRVGDLYNATQPEREADVERLLRYIERSSP